MKKTFKFYFIYITTNLINGKKYLGRHKTNNIDDGYIGCGIKTNVFNNSKTKGFGSAVNKYGYENFKREIIEFCDDEEHYKIREQYWLDFYDCKNSKVFYNISGNSDGGDYWKGKKRSPETIEKLRQVHIGKIPWNKGVKGIVKQKQESIEKGKRTRRENNKPRKPVTEEHRNNLRISHVGQKAWNKGLYGVIKKDEELRKKIKKNARKLFSKTIVQICPETGNYINIYDAICDVKLNGYQPSKVSRCCNRKLFQYRGFLWCFLDEVA